MRLLSYFKALQEGVELAKADTWKNRATAVNALVVFLTALAGLAPQFGWDFSHVSQETLTALAGGIFAAASLFNGYVHLASSKKVGLPPKPRRRPPP